MIGYRLTFYPIGMWYCTRLFRQVLPAVHWRPLTMPPPTYLPSQTNPQTLLFIAIALVIVTSFSTKSLYCCHASSRGRTCFYPFVCCRYLLHYLFALSQKLLLLSVWLTCVDRAESQDTESIHMSSRRPCAQSACDCLSRGNFARTEQSHRPRTNNLTVDFFHLHRCSTLSLFNMIEHCSYSLGLVASKVSSAHPNLFTSLSYCSMTTQ